MDNIIIVDIETSGINPKTHGMLSLGAVDFQTGEEFYEECRLRHGKSVEPIALQINGFTDKDIHDTRNADDGTVLCEFYRWAYGRASILGGHNVGHFDITFMEEINAFYGLGKFPFSHRTVDLHSIAYARFGKSLSHEQICIELGLAPEPKPHNALSGAKSELAAFRLLL